MSTSHPKTEPGSGLNSFRALLTSIRATLLRHFDVGAACGGPNADLLATV